MKRTSIVFILSVIIVILAVALVGTLLFITNLPQLVVLPP